jgi:hypothetical protein
MFSSKSDQNTTSFKTNFGFLHSVPVISANSAKMPPKKKQRVDGLPSSRPVRQRLSTYSRPVDTTCLTKPVTNVVTDTCAQQHSDLSSSGIFAELAEITGTLCKNKVKFTISLTFYLCKFP